jgi:hypothetical protein
MDSNQRNPQIAPNRLQSIIDDTRGYNNEEWKQEMKRLRAEQKDPNVRRAEQFLRLETTEEIRYQREALQREFKANRAANEAIINRELSQYFRQKAERARRQQEARASAPPPRAQDPHERISQPPSPQAASPVSPASDERAAALATEFNRLAATDASSSSSRSPPQDGKDQRDDSRFPSNGSPRSRATWVLHNNMEPIDVTSADLPCMCLICKKEFEEEAYVVKGYGCPRQHLICDTCAIDQLTQFYENFDKHPNQRSANWAKLKMCPLRCPRPYTLGRP